ncbi:MAG: cytochrome P450 [bacterium]
MKSFVGDGLPPGPSDDFYTGFSLAKDYYFGNVNYLLECYHEFGPVFTTRLMGLKVVWLIGAEANQHMYVDNWRNFYWWGESLEGHLAGLIGEGLLSSVDETHDKARKLLDPVFSKENLRKYVKGMIETTESEIQSFRDGQRFDFYEWVYDMALLNATDCFMGMNPRSVDTQELHENFDKCVHYYQYPIHAQTLRGPGTPHWTFKKAKEKIDAVLYDEIENRRQNGHAAEDNILDRLLEAEQDGQTFTDEEIHDQIMTLYWAGHDTTISAISWLILLVGKYPKVYDQLQTEIDERVGDEPVEADEVIDGLPYLEMVMDETMRLYPPAWVAQRKPRESFEMYGHEIPAGTELAFSSFVTHRLPHLFDRPEAFEPDRMKPENKRDFPPGAFIPFGRGPRTCIGMNFAKYEIKLIVASLLRQFDYELAPGQELKGYPVATLTPKEAKITVSRRSGGPSGTSPDRSNSEDRPSPSSDSDDTDSGCPVH